MNANFAHHMISGVLGLIGAVIYGVKMKDDLHWAYALTIIGSIAYLVAGGLAGCTEAN